MGNKEKSIGLVVWLLNINKIDLDFDRYMRDFGIIVGIWVLCFFFKGIYKINRISK